MRKIKKLIAVVICLTLCFSMELRMPTHVVKAKTATVITVDSWIDPGNYTKSWVNSVTGQDIYGNHGTIYEPYEIKSVKDFAALSYYSNSANLSFEGKYINVVAGEMDLAQHYWFPIGAATSFKGVFNGNGCMIKNVYIGKKAECSTVVNNGLFSVTYGNITDVNVENFVYYANSAKVGGLVGYWVGGNIKGCTAQGIINYTGATGDVGGLVGQHSTAGDTIENCSTSVSMKSYVNANSYHIRMGGLVGSLYCKTNVLNCKATGDITTGSTYEVGGLVGYINVASILKKSSADVVVSSENACQAGGIIGHDAAASSYENCYGLGNVSTGSSSNAGGFIGYCYSAPTSFKNCYAKGNIFGRTGSNAGGFGGNLYNNTLIQCGALGNVTLTSGTAGGFVGYYHCVKLINCYAIGDVEGEAGCSVGGFSGYNNSTASIDNCYAAGSVKAGSNSKIGGFSSNGNNNTTFRHCYWNKSADQTLDGASYAEDKKIGIGYSASTKVEAAAGEYMQTRAFAEDLNEYVEQSTEKYDSWETNYSLNRGFPYTTSLKPLFYDIAGGYEQIAISEKEDSKDKDMSVYGTFVYPDLPATEEPEPEPEDDPIHISLEWGSLEYQYTSGDYDEENQIYADGTWEAKEAGVTDLIRVVNKSESDIKASFTYLASDADEGNFLNIKGQFEDYELGQSLSDSVLVNAKESDVELSKTIRFGLTGTPVNRVDKGTPEEIGKIVLTVSKYVEPEQPEVTETPETSKEPEVSEAPETTKETETSETPEASKAPEVSEAPETSKEPEVSEVPETSKAVEISETPASNETETSKDVVTTEEEKTTIEGKE